MAALNEAQQELLARIQRAVVGKKHEETKSCSSILQEPQVHECVICGDKIPDQYLFRVMSNEHPYFYDIFCLKKCYDANRYKADPMTGVAHTFEEVKAVYDFYEKVTNEKSKSGELTKAEYVIRDQFRNVLEAANYGTWRTTPTTYDEVNHEINFCLAIANNTLINEDQFPAKGFDTSQSKQAFMNQVKTQCKDERQRITLAMNRAQQEAIRWTASVFVGEGLIAQATQRILASAANPFSRR
jgi:hypothetical protein